jgi:parallel beta-helix repeat protein
MQGITLEGAADSNDVSGNRVTGNGNDLIIADSGNRITGNFVSDTVDCGPDCGGYGTGWRPARTT